jgi:hypothetical protein
MNSALETLVRAGGQYLEVRVPKILQAMRVYGPTPDRATHTTMIKRAGLVGDLEGMLVIVRGIVNAARKDPEQCPDTIRGNATLEALARVKALSVVELVLADFLDLGVQPSSHTLWALNKSANSPAERAVLKKRLAEWPAKFDFEPTPEVVAAINDRKGSGKGSARKGEGKGELRGKGEQKGKR